MRIVLTDEAVINGHKYKAKDELNVSSSIRNRLVEDLKVAKDFVAKEEKPKKDK